MNSNSEVSDDHIIEIPPDHTPNQSHEQTPIATSTTSPSPKHGSIGVNELTPEELSSLKEDLAKHISIIDKCPDVVRFPLNDSGDTALHLAVKRNSLQIVNELLNRMRPEDMLIKNSSGDTALHLALIRKRRNLGNLRIVNELVKRMRPKDMGIQNSSGDTALHLAARCGSFGIVTGLVKRMRPEDMGIQNLSGDTALHLAAVSEGYMAGIGNKLFVDRMMTSIMLKRKNSTALKKLVKRMRPEDMGIQNSSGDTALHLAVKRGSLEIVKELVQRMRPGDMLIQNSFGDTALHVAVSQSCRDKIVTELVSSMRPPEDMLIQNSSGDTAFHLAIRLDRFDLATLLFEKQPTTLATARNKENLTALHMLARKPPNILDMEGERSEGGRLFEKLWKQVEHKRMIDEITYPSPVLFDAIKSGNVEAVQWIIRLQPELVRIKDPKNGRNLLHWVVLFQQKRIFNSISETLKEHQVREVDNAGNNILHLAAHLPPVDFEELSSLRASIQMQREFEWFKFVEREVPGELRTMRNTAGKTPIDVFCDEHKKLSEEIKDAAKGIAESGMLVSTLVATVAFAAALTVPGDKTNAWFNVFILTNAVALFTSSASLLSFLSNFTSSRFAQSEFVISLHPSLTFGRWLLIISVAAMVVAFTAASFLIFDHTSKWVSYAVASMGLFPILLFLLFQFNFFDEHLWSRYYRLSKQDKLTYYRRLQQAVARVADRVTGRVRDRFIDCVTLRVNRHRHNLNAKNC